MRSLVALSLLVLSQTSDTNAQCPSGACAPGVQVRVQISQPAPPQVRYTILPTYAAAPVAYTAPAPILYAAPAPVLYAAPVYFAPTPRRFPTPFRDFFFGR